MVDRLLNTREVALRLDMSEGALSQLRYKGEGPDYVRINSKNIRYRESEIEAWLDRQTVTKAKRAER